MAKLLNRLSNKQCPEGMSVEEWQVALRREQAIDSDFVVEHLDDNRIWGDYLVSSSSSGGRYKVAFRGVCSERNYCSCLDFRTNGLGTCKHLEAVSLWLQQEVEGYPWSGRSYDAPYSSVYVSYKGRRCIRMRIGTEQSEAYLKLHSRYFAADGALAPERYPELARLMEEGEAISSHFRVYEDVFTFAQEELAHIAWRERLAKNYPEERIPYAGGAEQERALYQLCYHENALVVSPKHPANIAFVAALVRAVYANETQLRPSYIIVDTEVEAKQWSRLLEVGSLPVELITAETFIKRINSTHPSVCLVWVDNAKGLRDWKDELSLALKKLSIAHLYMRLESIEDISPIQLSSTLQHISPYLLGPLYKFVHRYRSTFPLLNDGSNAPEEVRGSLFYYYGLFEQSTWEQPSPAPTLSSQQKVDQLLQALYDVLADDQARTILQQELHERLHR